jgi:ABC-2 type transport system ATP-binding protein
MAGLLVETRGLERRFGARCALAGVELEVRAGEIVGLVGPNGSGKTTLLRILAGLLRPTAGMVRVAGFDPSVEREEVMRVARFAFAPPALLENLTAREHLAHFGGLGGARVVGAESERVLGAVGLAARADERVRSFSFGMRQRLTLALSLIPRPALLVLDEPTEGLDPLAVLELRGILAALRREQGLAVLLSSHLLLEIDQLVDRMLVLSEGRVLFSGAPAELVAGTERVRWRVSDAERALVLARARGLAAEPAGAGGIELAVSPPLGEVAAWLAGHGITLEGYARERATLEQALLARLAREEQA